MIRKAIIVMLTLATLVAAVACLLDLATIGLDEMLTWKAGPISVGGDVGRPWIGVTLQQQPRVDASLYWFDGRIKMSLTKDMSAPPVIKTWDWCGFGLKITGATSLFTGTQAKSWILFGPSWISVLIPCAYPAIAFIRGPLRRYRRRRRGLCIRCGYNLEGNVSGVCPECGEAR